jgi:hypothetical protein
MTLTKHLLGASAVLALSAGTALANPAVIYDLGGKFDKSFNEAAFNGAQRWAEETGGTYLETQRKVVIGPNVKISDGGTGWTLVTPEAVVDTETGVVTGDKGVQGRGPLGSINASSYAIYDQGQRVVFNGQGETKVSGTINPAGADR